VGVNLDQALMAPLRLIRDASLPMLILIGPGGALVANDLASRLICEMAGQSGVNASTATAIPHLAPDYAQIWSRAVEGRSTALRERKIRVMRGGDETSAWFNFDFMPVRAPAGDVIAVMEVISEITPYVSRAEERLASTESVRMALEASDMVGIWSLDVETDTCISDSTVARMFGLSPADCARGINVRHFIDAIAAEDQSKVNHALHSAAAFGIPYRCRYRLTSDDGDARWVIASGKPEYDAAGNVVGLRGTVVDITETMTAVAALQESRFQFQTLTETLPQIVWSSDSEGRHDYFSGRWSEYTGLPREGITKNTLKQLIYPPHRQKVSEAWSRAVRTGMPYDLDYKFRHYSGEYRWLRVMALPMRDEQGRIKRWFGTSTDVHESYLLAEEREKLAREHERVASVDHLTEVLTRRAFIARATAAIEQLRRLRQPTSLIMLDIDNFKKLNDAHGHEVGDEALIHLARVVRHHLRPQDVLARYGGEEFVILLPETGKADAYNTLTRLQRELTREFFMTDHQKIVITFSAGVTLVNAGESMQPALNRADKAMYQAKQAGRNRVIIAEPN